MEVSEVAPGIDRLETMLGARRLCVYALHASPASLLFDVPVDGDSSREFGPYFQAQRRAASSPQWIVISHCEVDHFGGLADARQTFPAAQVGAHRLDAGAISSFDVFLKVRGRGFLDEYGLDEDPAVLEWERDVTSEGPADLRAVGGEIIETGDRAVELRREPGHTRGHLVLRDLTAGTLIIGDAVLGVVVPNADGSGAFPPTYRDVEQYLETIGRLRGLHGPLVLSAHDPVYRGAEVTEFFDRERFAKDLGARVELGLRETPGATLAGITDALNDGSGNWPTEGTNGMLAFPVAGHVEQLIAQGSATLQPCAEPGSGAKIWLV
jgi:glyoxylase-like metal-dependent hydrolase (beta-lactamase superfamily II)